MLNIRAAQKSDCANIVQLISELAEYEKLAREAKATPEQIENALFSENPNAFCEIAEWDGQLAGLALYFYNFSTFIGRDGLYLEDLFVRPSIRGKGIGKALLLKLVQIAKEQNCGRMEWSVLDWNTPAIEFYKSLGAKPMDEWTVFRLDEKALAELSKPSI